MKILVIDNNIMRDSWGAPELRELAHLAQGASVHVRRAPHQDLPSSPKGYDRIVVSGSKTSASDDAPWISELEQFIRSTLDLGIPYLGVCYGHQILARSLGGKGVVRKAAEPELGWTRIEIIEDSPLFKDLPRSFHTFSSHYDEVHELPRGFRRLAESDRCRVQACQLESRPVFGIQFHPERGPEGALKYFKEMKAEGKSKLLLRPNDTEKLYDSEIARRIFLNFFGPGI